MMFCTILLCFDFLRLFEGKIIIIKSGEERGYMRDIICKRYTFFGGGIDFVCFQFLVDKDK